MHLMALGAFWPSVLMPREIADGMGLNAPYGARCFLTLIYLYNTNEEVGLNAPYGARCFLTHYISEYLDNLTEVLMHLMALGAF